MGCVNVKVSDEVRNAPMYPEKRESTNFFWLIVFLGIGIFTCALVFTCYRKSNWYNIIDIQDYDGSGWGIWLTQHAVTYWQNIGVAMGCSIAICLVMLILLIWLSSIFLVLSLGVVSLYLIIVVALVWDQYDKLRSTEILVSAICLSIFMFLWFFMFVRIGKKIELIFHLFHLAGEAIKNNLRMLLYAPAIFFLNCLGLAICIYFFCIVTAAWMEFRKFNDERNNMPLINWSYGAILVFSMWWVHFMQGCLNFVVGYAVGAWYFRVPTVGKKLFEKSGTILLVRYHMGTMCFGSFVLTIFWIIREILDMLRQIKLSNRFYSIIGTFAEWILICTQACWEIAATNSNYITAMYGFGYCSATRRTIELSDNALQMSVGLVGNALIYMCVLMVALVSATVGVTAIEIESVQSMVVVGVFLFFICFGLGWMLLSVYVNITRGIYMCICVDLEANGIALGPDVVDPKITKYVAMVPKFSPPPPPPPQAPPPILPKGKRYEEDSEEEEEEEEEQMVQIIEV